MEDWIVIPDVHGRDFWRSAVRGREEEKIIFLGDYVDPYSWEGITPHVAFLELQDIIEFKKAHPDNVVLLLGNHDLGYLDREICDCRRDELRAGRLRELFEKELDLFDIVNVEGDETGKALFSHAGIAERWVKGREDIVGSPVWADVNEYLDGENLIDGYIHIFGHTFNMDGPVTAGRRGLCLDCARAFRLDSGILRAK